MRNFAVKFAILINRQVQALSRSSAVPEGPLMTLPHTVTAQELLDEPPMDMLELYKQELDRKERGILRFGFTDQAILDILDADFEVDVERGVLIFRKTSLDSASVKLALGQGQSTYLLPDDEAEALVTHLSNWLFEASRELYREDLNEFRVADIKYEYAVCLRNYADKLVSIGEGPGHADVLHQLLASVKAMKAFLHSLTADAIFKMDAAGLLFGEQSGYAQAWMRKKFFRNLVAQSVESYIVRHAA